jgi:hypothetical protein
MFQKPAGAKLQNVIGNQPDDDTTDNLERDYENIDVKKSIQTSRLFFKNDFAGIMNTSIVILFFSFLVGTLIFSLYKDFSEQADIDFTYVILKIVGILIFSYVVFRKLTEKKLFSITTNLSKEKAQQIVNDHFERLKYRKPKKSADIINYVDNSPFFGSYNYFIIPLDNKILYTVIKDQNRLPLPAIITLWTTRGDLKKLCVAGNL